MHSKTLVAGAMAVFAFISGTAALDVLGGYSMEEAEELERLGIITILRGTRIAPRSTYLSFVPEPTQIAISTPTPTTMLTSVVVAKRSTHVPQQTSTTAAVELEDIFDVVPPAFDVDDELAAEKNIPTSNWWDRFMKYPWEILH